jgi:hypothetical protein
MGKSDCPTPLIPPRATRTFTVPNSRILVTIVALIRERVPRAHYGLQAAMVLFGSTSVCIGVIACNVPLITITMGSRHARMDRVRSTTQLDGPRRKS